MADSNLIYITVPTKYEHIYLAMLSAATNYGEQALKECKCQCDDKYCTLMECFNLFHSVVAAYRQEEEKLADTIAKYISAKLETIGIFSTPIQSLTTEFIYSDTDHIDTLVIESVRVPFIDGYYVFERVIDSYLALILVIPTDVVVEKAVVIDNGIESDITDFIEDLSKLETDITLSGNDGYLLAPQRPFSSGTKLKVLFKK